MSTGAILSAARAQAAREGLATISQKTASSDGLRRGDEMASDEAVGAEHQDAHGDQVPGRAGPRAGLR